MPTESFTTGVCEENKVDDRLIFRGADRYDEARFAHVFNVRRPERYPAQVLVAESEDDVVEGVRLARDRGWKVAIRAGGSQLSSLERTKRRPVDRSRRL
jgi:FAD/FMN-containing dehydrogenase